MSQLRAEELGVVRVRKREGQCAFKTQPAQFGVLRTLDPRLARPCRDDEHVVPGVSVFGRPWLPKDGHLLEDMWSDAYLFLKLANEGLGWSLVPIAMSAEEVPHARIERPILRALGQEDLVSANEQAPRADSHALRGIRALRQQLDEIAIRISYVRERNTGGMLAAFDERSSRRLDLRDGGVEA